MNPLVYLRGYLETNHFTFYFLAGLAALSGLKYLKTPPVRPRVALGLIVALGLALRLAWLGFSPYEPKTDWDLSHMLESDVTNIHALELSEKGVWFHDFEGKPTARRPIGYPVFLALLYKIFGPHIPVVWAANLALYAAAALLLYVMGRGLWGPAAGLLAAFFFSIYPASVYSIKLVTDEHLFLPLWYAGLCLLFREAEGKRVPWATAAYGLLFGYATMTRTYTIFMPVVVALAYRLSRRSWRRALGAAAGVLLVMQLINLPWLARNYRVWGVPIPYTADAWHYIYKSLNFSATPEGGGHIPVEGEPGYSKELEEAWKSGNVGRYNALCAQKAKEWILRNPGKFALLGSCRLLYFMAWDRSGGFWPTWFQFQEGSYDPKRAVAQPVKDALEEAGYAFYYGLFFSFIFGVAIVARHWRRLSSPARVRFCIVGACLLFWFAEHTIIFPDRKYRFPLEPLMMLVAAVFWEAVLCRFRWEKLGEVLRGRRSQKT